MQTFEVDVSKNSEIETGIVFDIKVSMPRIPRSLIVLPGFAVHKIWRSHNREWNIKSPDEKKMYMHLMAENFVNPSGNRVEAVTLMSNHAHEVLYIEDVKLFSNQMRQHHGAYGQFFNKKHKRSGKVARDRPKTCLIGDDGHAMRVVFYIHANPVRAKIVRNANNYRWSTHKLYAFGKRESWMNCVALPAWYLNLGRNMVDRQRKYRKLFDFYLRQSGLMKSRDFERPFFGPTLWMLPLYDRIKIPAQCHSPPKFA